MEYLRKKPDWNNKKILLIRLDRLGDLIVSTPAMRAIRKAFPDSQIDLLGSHMNRALFKYCEYLDNTYCYDKRHLLDAVKLIFSLRAKKYDVVICLSPHSKTSNFYTQCIGAPIKLAICEPPKKHQKIYTYSAPASSQANILEFYKDCMEQMGFEMPEINPVINIPSSVREDIDLTFPKNTEKKRIIISIGNILRPHKRWKVSYYAQVIKSLHEKYNSEKQLLDIIIMVGKSDLPLLDELGDLPKDYYTLYIGTDIAQSAALIDNSNLFVCTSSGPSHIAASTSCPILSLITPYMYNHWRPIREHDTCIVNEDIHSIKVEEVVERIEQYINS